MGSPNSSNARFQKNTREFSMEEKGFTEIGSTFDDKEKKENEQQEKEEDNRRRPLFRASNS